MSSGVLVAIWLKRAHRGKMDPMSAAILVEGQGVAGSVGRSRRRQVSLLEEESWQACMRELDGDIDPAARRANLLIRGVRLAHTRGQVLCIGDTRLAIGGELTPCERMDDALPGLQEAMRPNWRGGAFAQVLSGGSIRVGDVVRWERERIPED
jgi:MOSC domain-containing protein YiiM